MVAMVDELGRVRRLSCQLRILAEPKGFSSPHHGQDLERCLLKWGSPSRIHTAGLTRLAQSPFNSMMSGARCDLEGMD